ncbi:MAG: topoisomerase DNA-binding C4 zinc finger domain-containing protein, partial [Pseudomonadota bacterium]|nr:topoisomerase DNA-binding C4 zinc finger domain-containing protein [Pseudomonadota bacterium]
KFFCPLCGGQLRKKTYSENVFWGCSNYPECKATLDDVNGEPASARKYPCRACGHYLVRKKGAKGHFWGCIKYPECRHTLPDDNGQPVPRKLRG